MRTCKISRKAESSILRRSQKLIKNGTHVEENKQIIAYLMAKKRKRKKR